jgi:hypothetical protein
MEEARLSVQHGQAAGMMYYPQNFSRALQNRRDNFNSVTEEEIVAGEIHTTLDMGGKSRLYFSDYYIRRAFGPPNLIVPFL